MRDLRSRCEWDAAQTHESLRPYLIEEAHELDDALRDSDDSKIREELGDVLLQVLFHAVVAEQRGAFGIADVAAGLIDKMQRRHPHLFGDGKRVPWETLKARKRAAIEEGLPPGLPSLHRAHRLQDRAAGVNFDWADVRGPLEKVVEELGEVSALLRGVEGEGQGASNEGRKVSGERRGASTEEQAASSERHWHSNEGRAASDKQPASSNEEPAASGDRRGASGPGQREQTDEIEGELGDLLFAVVNLCRKAGVHAALALDKANAKFVRRFSAMEQLAAQRGIDVASAGLAVLDGLWNEVKAGEVGSR
ncbi:MAG: nucleoside triphosphate pyrophosphohydrolase [Gemmatimonadaceae bacterium]